jgi:serine protease Do
MNTAIATGRQSSLDEGQFSGIGLAIPLEMIEPAVDQIIEKGFVEKGYLGVGVDDLSAVNRRVLDFQGDGVLLDYVEPDGPAERAGLRMYDVITAINGQPVERQTQLQSVISSTLPGDSIELDVWRPRTPQAPQTTLTITVTLDRLDSIRLYGELPADQSLERIPALGIDRMITSTPEVAKRLEIKFHRGVVLEALVPNSPLSRRVRVGATIVEVRGRPVASVEEFVEELRRFDLRTDPFGGGVLVGVIQPDGRYQPVPLRVE